MNGKEISIFNSFTGTKISVNGYYFVSLDELKKSCSNQFNIPLNQVFLLSPFGIRVKTVASLEEVDEIYVFDKTFFSTNDTQQLLRRYLRSQSDLDNLESLLQPINSPLLDIDLKYVTESKNSRQLAGLLTTNLGWVAAIESDSVLFAKRIEAIRERIHIILKSLRVASQYIDVYCLSVKKSFDSCVDFVIDLQKHSLSLTWKDHYAKLKNLKFTDDTPLSNLLDDVELDKKSHEIIKLNDSVNNELIGWKSKIVSSQKERKLIDDELKQIDRETSKVLKAVDSIEVIKELHLLSGKVKNDTKHLLDKTKMSIDKIDIELILETFQTHKSDFVTKIYDSSLNLYNFLIKLKKFSDELQINTSKFLKRLSVTQGEMVTLKESLKSTTATVENIQTLESTLAHTVDLPLLYGFYIIEIIRRNQWVQNFKVLGSKTNEKLATLREKEIKARSQWLKNYGIVLNLLNYDIGSFNSTNLVNFDLNINNITNSSSTRKNDDFTINDCVHYIQQLKSQNFSSEIIDALSKALEELPMKKLNLSLETTRDSASNNDVIKGYKSRIKKLESLLHQEQFKNFSQWPTNTGSRLSALSRYSINFEPSTASTNSNLEGTINSGGSLFKSPSPSENSEDFNKLTIENKELNKNLKRYKNTVEALNDELKTVRQITSTKEFDYQTVVKEMEQLKDSKQSEITNLQLKLSEKDIENTKLSYLNESQENEIKTLKQNLKDKENSRKSVEDKLLNEIKDLKTQLDSRSPGDEILSELEVVKSQLQDSLDRNQKLEGSISEKESLLDDALKSIKEKDEAISRHESSHKESTTEFEQRFESLVKDNQKLQSKVEDFERLKSMKNDLLENMTNRENEFAKEKSAQQDEIENLQNQLDELKLIQETNPNTDNRHVQIIIQLIIVINSLAIKSRDMSDILIQFYDVICKTLKSIGLLPVQSKTENKVDIIRVKGLRKPNSGSTTVGLTNGFNPIVENEIANLITWRDLPDTNILTELSKFIESEESLDDSNINKTIEDLCEDLIETYNLTTFESSYLTFIAQITNLNLLYTSSVSKRFREVEHLAKKELKDNKTLRNNERQKISIKNFQNEDLVLFLPTRNNNSSNGNTNGVIQWAAFNDMGDVKYLLKNDEIQISPQKQWFVGKILDIEEVDKNEYYITAEEITIQ